MAIIIDGKKVSQKIKDEVKEKVAALKGNRQRVHICRQI